MKIQRSCLGAAMVMRGLKTPLHSILRWYALSMFCSIASTNLPNRHGV